MERKPPMNPPRKTDPAARPMQPARGRIEVLDLLGDGQASLDVDSALILLCRYRTRGTPLEDLRAAHACLGRLIAAEERKAEAVKVRKTRTARSKGSG